MVLGEFVSRLCLAAMLAFIVCSLEGRAPMYLFLFLIHTCKQNRWLPCDSTNEDAPARGCPFIIYARSRLNANAALMFMLMLFCLLLCPAELVLLKVTGKQVDRLDAATVTLGDEPLAASGMEKNAKEARLDRMVNHLLKAIDIMVDCSRTVAFQTLSTF